MVQAVRGTHDVLPDECQLKNHLLSGFRQLCAKYGYGEIETPIFEFSDVFHRLGETSDVVSKETYTFTDRGGESLTLRPEGTAGVVRSVIEHGLGNQLPLRLGYVGPMFRYERPQKGRYRQFDQMGVELFGPHHPHADLEVLALSHDFLKTLGLQQDVTLRINTLGNEEERAKYRRSLANFFGPHHGDLSPESLDRLRRNPLRFLDSKSELDQAIVDDAPLFSYYMSSESMDFFDQVLDGLTRLGIPYVWDKKLVRGLDYYSHTVFEWTTDTLGAQGTVLAGGRYDGLVQQMGGPDLPGVGFAAGLSRLMLLSTAFNDLQAPQTVAFIPLGRMAEQTGLTLCHQLRCAGVRVEQSFSGNLQKRLKWADRIGARWAVIIGDDELASKQAVCRDLKTGAQTSVALDQVVPFCLNATTTSA